MALTPQRAPIAGLEPVKRYDTLADRAYEQLRAALTTGSFFPGQKLTIRKIAAILGVSATPVRDAISRLLFERVLECDINRNVFVPRLDAQRLRHIYALRIALEGLAAEEGTRVLTDEDVDRLEQVQLALIAAMDRQDYSRVLVENEKFHFGIYSACGNPLLVEAIQQLWIKLGPTMNLLYPTYNKTRTGVSHHLKVITALRTHDPKQVRAAIEADLRDGEIALRQALEVADEEAATKTVQKRRRKKAPPAEA